METQLFTMDILARLGLAMLAGMILGLNRWMHHKSAGIRTHTLVSLGGALGMMLMASVTGGDAQAQSHVLQGTISGIGFLGAGVIVQGLNNCCKHLGGCNIGLLLWGRANYCRSPWLNGCFTYLNYWTFFRKRPCKNVRYC
jgi:uncharacterized membrane protein YhiD involved in acid resistance